LAKEKRLVRREQTIWIEIVCSTLVVLVAAFAGFCFGVHYSQETFQPQVVTEYATLPPVEVGALGEVTNEAEVIKEVAREVREFESLDELKGWLETDETDKCHIMILHIDPGMSGTFNIGECCEDYAMRLQKSALDDGYIMSVSTIWGDEYNALFTQKQCQYCEKHTINLTIIGNRVWYIEPQNDEIQFAINLD